MALKPHGERSNLFFMRLAVAGVATLALSILPDVLFRELTGSVPSWLYGAKLALIGAMLLIILFVQALKPLASFFMIFLTVMVADGIGQWVSSLPQWQSLSSTNPTDFVGHMAGSQLVRLLVTIIVFLGLMLMGWRRRDFFFTIGDLNAPAPPMPEVGSDKPTTWKRRGPQLCLYAFLALLLVIGAFFVGNLQWDSLGRVIPLLPFVVLFAAINSFSEEVTYRSALLGPLHRVIGGTNALLFTAVYFGMGHFYGVPSGILGIAVSTFFGWILGRSMLETKGLFWPWAIHMCADIVIFSFIAIGAVQI